MVNKSNKKNRSEINLTGFPKRALRGYLHTKKRISLQTSCQNSWDYNVLKDYLEFVVVSLFNFNKTFLIDYTTNMKAKINSTKYIFNNYCNTQNKNKRTKKLTYNTLNKKLHWPTNKKTHQKRCKMLKKKAKKVDFFSKKGILSINFVTKKIP